MAEEKDEIVFWQSLGFYRALSEQVLVLGVPNGILAINFVIGYLFLINLGFPYIIILNLLIHYGAQRVAKDDDRFFECLKIYQGKKNYYNT